MRIKCCAWLFCALFLSAPLAFSEWRPFTTHRQSAGREGESFTQNGTLWQPVYYKSGNGTLKGLLPGSPSAAFSNGSFHLTSEYEGSVYWIRVYLYNSPKRWEEFLSFLQKAISENLSFSKVLSSPTNVLHAAQFETTDGPYKRVGRLIATKNLLYSIGGEGENIEPIFKVFDSLKFDEK